MKELAQNEIFSETSPDAINELKEIAERISKICKKLKIDFVFSFSVLTEVGNNEYKDSRFVSFGLYCETTSPYIHAASEIVDSHIDPQRIQELTLALQLLRENGECNCSDCQHEKKKTTHKTTNQATLH
ncbi:TPA: hypothetical protein ACHOT1_000282 [Escherichia coli]|nr:hypothetical protein [Escherichia coli]EFS4848618.1 hypothetical protein [Escherichia coli]EII2915785.1 hypothetical protein [Escherichia coli]ELA4513289.1 hypothetical protein [Escherichia coli]ELE9585842.1 hypothetical protein [Escherichia coli]